MLILNKKYAIKLELLAQSIQDLKNDVEKILKNRS